MLRRQSLVSYWKDFPSVALWGHPVKGDRVTWFWPRPVNACDVRRSAEAVHHEQDCCFLSQFLDGAVIVVDSRGPICEENWVEDTLC